MVCGQLAATWAASISGRMTSMSRTTIAKAAAGRRNWLALVYLDRTDGTWHLERLYD